MARAWITAIIATLLTASPALSQTLNINTVCGSGCDFTTIGDCEANTETVAANTIEICEIQASSSPYNESAVTWDSGDTFSATSHRRFRGETGTTVGTDNNNTVQNVHEVTEDWFEMGQEGFEVFGEEWDGFNARWVRFSGSANSTAQAVECFDAGRSNTFCIEWATGSTGTISNVIAHDLDGIGPFLFFGSGGATAANVYHNSCYNAGDHCYDYSGTTTGTLDFRNNIGIDATNNNFENQAEYDTEDYNITSGTELTGVNSIESETAANVYTDAVNGDLTLVGGSPAIDAGVDVSVTLDITGATRSATPDIGAYDGGAEGAAPAGTRRGGQRKRWWN